MNIKSYFNNLATNSNLYNVLVGMVIFLWSLTLMVVGAFLFLFLEQSGQAQPPPSEPPIAALAIDPAVGVVGDTLTVRGSDWPTGTTVLLYLTTPEADRIPTYATFEVLVDADGRFTTTFELLPESQWSNQKSATLIAQTANGQTVAQASFTVLGVAATPTATGEPIPTSEPTASPRPAEPSPTPEPPTPTSKAPTPEPSRPEARLTSTANLNVRAGPGLGYKIIGLLRPGQSANITAVSPDGSWWQIEFPTAADDHGWVSAGYVVAENTDNVPAAFVPPVQAAPTPTPTQKPTASPKPTPTPSPVVVTAWRGEYFSNRHLAGPPTLIRNDGRINFNWGRSSPDPALPADNFSARWSRNLHFDAGHYRFHAKVDDGVRFYVDDVLVIDHWYDSSVHQVSGEHWLGWGRHNLRVEYYEHSHDAIIQTWWERISAPSASNAPRARFSADDKSGSVPHEVDFDNDSEGDFDSCKWYFGDGDTSSRCSDREHTYDEPGEYTVKLRVRGPGGEDTEKKEDYITVRPVAKFSYTPVSGQPRQVRFTNQSEFYERSEWDFGDGATSTAAHPTHSYAAGGSYTVRLRVKDEGVWSNTTRRTVDVGGASPVANFNAGPTTGTVPLAVTFTNSSSGDIQSCLWNFGDGTTSSSCGNPVHTYATAGTYSVQLTVNGPGGSDTALQTDLIQVGQPTQADFSAQPTSGSVPLEVTFTNLSSGDYDSCIWVVGDGHAQVGCDNFTHRYTTPGDKTVILTINGPGGRDEMAKPSYISVTDAPPVPTAEPPTPTPEPPTPTPEPPTPTPEPPTPTPEPPTPTPEPPTPTPEPPTPTPEPPTPTPEPPTPTPEPPTPTPEPPTPTPEPPTPTPEPPTPTPEPPTPTPEPPTPTPEPPTPTPEPPTPTPEPPTPTPEPPTPTPEPPTPTPEPPTPEPPTPTPEPPIPTPEPTEPPPET